MTNLEKMERAFAKNECICGGKLKLIWVKKDPEIGTHEKFECRKCQKSFILSENQVEDIRKLYGEEK